MLLGNFLKYFLKKGQKVGIMKINNYVFLNIGTIVYTIYKHTRFLCKGIILIIFYEYWWATSQ